MDEILGTLIWGYAPSLELIDSRFPVFIQRSSGLMLTVLITIGSLVIGTIFGLILAVFRRQAPDIRANRGALRLVVRYIAVLLIEGVRGLPIALLILLGFHLPYRMLGLRVPETVLAIGVFSLYAAVYLAEIFRAGWRSLNPEHRQAGRVLGLNPRQIIIRIELPLVIRVMMPDLISVAVTVFKDTTTLAIVAVPELTYVGRQITIGEPTSYGLVLLIIMILYWIPSSLCSVLALHAENRRKTLEGNGHVTG